MTTTTLSQPVTTATEQASRLRTLGVIGSEWIKALSLRSIRWSIITSIVLGVAMSLAIGVAIRELMAEEPIPDHAAFLVTVTSFPANLLALVFGVLGVFVFSSEYASGMILSTLTATPRRGTVLVAKAVVLTAIATMVAALVVTAGVGIGVALIPESAAAIWTTQVLTGLVGTVVFLVAVALFSFAVAGIVRSTAGGITIVVAVVFLFPTLLQIVGSIADWPWVDLVMNYLPSTLGRVLGAGITDTIDPAAPTPSYWNALFALVMWVVLPMNVAATMFKARDAA